MISGGGKTVKYGDLIGGKNFSFTMPIAGGGTTERDSRSGHREAGRQLQARRQAAVHRIDIPAKVMGTYTYIHNVRIPGMVHARSVRPRGAGANTSQNHFPLSVDASSISHIPGAQVVQINNFLAVVAPKEYDAIQAAAQLKVVWKSDPKFGSGSSGNYWSWMRKAGDTNTDNPARYTADTGNVPAALAGAAKTVSATYKYHYNNFVPIGPHAAIADVKGTTSAVVYVQGQSLPSGSARRQLEHAARASRPQNIRVIWYEGSSSYGGGQQAAGRRAGSDASRRRSASRCACSGCAGTSTAGTATARPTCTTSRPASTRTARSSPWTGRRYGQAGRDASTRTRELLGTATWPAVPASGGPTPSDAAVYNTASYQSAAGAGEDAAAVRRFAEDQRPPGSERAAVLLRQRADRRRARVRGEHGPDRVPPANIDGSTVVGASAGCRCSTRSTIAAGWKPKVAASDLQERRRRHRPRLRLRHVRLEPGRRRRRHRGEQEDRQDRGEARLVAQNNGITVNLEGVTTQMSGALIQGLSRALYEQATWNKERVTSLDWVSYPILRFKDSPTVTLINVHPGKYTVVTPGRRVARTCRRATPPRSTRAGACPARASRPRRRIGSAVANAFFDATGVRIRQAPMNPATVRQVLKDAGVA